MQSTSPPAIKNKYSSAIKNIKQTNSSKTATKINIINTKQTIKSIATQHLKQSNNNHTINRPKKIIKLIVVDKPQDLNNTHY